MKTALIPPNAELGAFCAGDLHLPLAHLCKDKKYVHHYYDQRARGAYLILDNSAHEYRSAIDEVTLAVIAKHLNAQEVVVPDVLENGPATIDRGLDALETWYESSSSLMRDLNPALMYVPQGIDIEAYYTCMDELINMHLYMARRRGLRRDFVLGISKDYQDVEGGLMGILQTVETVRQSIWEEKEIKMHVHLLGWSRNLWVLNDLARRYPWIRSTDSAKPFVYALAGITLNPKEDPPLYPGRHRTAYFKQTLTRDQYVRAVTNAEIFGQCARGEL